MATFTLSNDLIPAGTIVLFGQDSAPTGWTRETGWQDGAMLCFAQAGNIEAGGASDGRSAATHSDDFTTDNENTHTHTNTLTTNDEAAHTHKNSLSTDADTHSHTDDFTTDGESSHAHSDDFAVADESSHTHGSAAHEHVLAEKGISGYPADVPGGWEFVTSSPHLYATSTTPNATGSGSAHSHGLTGSVGTGDSHSHGISGGVLDSGSHNHGISGSVDEPDAAHNHSISGNVGVPDADHNHGMSGSVSNHSVPKYQEVIAASKD